ncbi:hypothetical protein HY251_21450, partial [bacterium]|nr:hypothetical protein [bacterium]
VVDVRRGALVWKREIPPGLTLSSIAPDRITLSGEKPLELDVATGRRLEPRTSKDQPAKPGTIDIK